MKPIKVIVTRDVLDSDPHNFYGCNVYAGEVFWTFRLSTYGCVDENEGIALSEQEDEYPFFEFPRDAVRRLQPDNPVAAMEEAK